MCDRCNNTIRKLEDEVKVAQDKLVQVLYGKIFCPLNDDGIDYNDEIERKAKEIKDMYITKTTTNTTESPSTECPSHEFVDVYDYKEEKRSNFTDITTKKYILTYCKVCGYTINRPCTECM